MAHLPMKAGQRARRSYPALLAVGVVLAIFHLFPVRAFAQNESVEVRICNKGTVPVEVVVAQSEWDLQDMKRGSANGHWEIIGRTYQPGQCREAYSSTRRLPELFIGFGFKSAHGRFTSGVVSDIPDWGLAPSSSLLAYLIDKAAGKPTQKTLSRSDVSVCAATDSTVYSSEGDAFPAADSCEDFSVRGGGHNPGPFYPLTLALHFFPSPSVCRDLPYDPHGVPPCAGGDYYMNIVGDPATGEVTFTEGTPDGDDAPPVDPRIKAMEDKVRQQFFDGLRKALEKGAEDERKRIAAEEPMAKADAARKEFEERQSKIDYNAEHERNLGRIRELAKFSPDWLRSTELLYIRGTVSRVELPTGRQPWARFYFTESPDGAFVACVYAALFSNLQRYVGQRVEVRGMVGQGRCGARADVQVNNPSMVYDLSKGTPSDEAVLPGMKEASSGNTSSGMAAIPIATRLRVSLGSQIDLLHAKDNETFQGQLAAAVTLPDGVIPQGAAVTLVHDRWAKLGVQSVSANGKIWRVATKIDPAGDADLNAGSLPAGATLVFVVAGTDRAVPTGR